MLELTQQANEIKAKTSIDLDDLVKIYKCFDYENLKKNADLLVKKIEFDLRCYPGMSTKYNYRDLKIGRSRFFESPFFI